MDSMRGKNLALCSTLLLLLVGFASSDLNQDKAECADKLIGLEGCLAYVGGQDKVPATGCCSGLKQVVDKNKKCLCILIKDHDDPNLGIKINLTLALQLPSACHVPTNVTECVDLLHLAPNSPEAKEFEGLGKTTGTNSSTAVPSSANNATGGAGKGSSSSAQDKSGGVLRKGWLGDEEVFWILAPYVFIWHFLFLV